MSSQQERGREPPPPSYTAATSSSTSSNSHTHGRPAIQPRHTTAADWMAYAHQFNSSYEESRLGLANSTHDPPPVYSENDPLEGTFEAMREPRSHHAPAPLRRLRHENRRLPPRDTDSSSSHPRVLANSAALVDEPRDRQAESRDLVGWRSFQTHEAHHGGQPPPPDRQPASIQSGPTRESAELSSFMNFPHVFHPVRQPMPPNPRQQSHVCVQGPSRSLLSDENEPARVRPSEHVLRAPQQQTHPPAPQQTPSAPGPEPWDVRNYFRSWDSRVHWRLAFNEALTHRLPILNPSEEQLNSKGNGWFWFSTATLHWYRTHEPPQGQQQRQWEHFSPQRGWRPGPPLNPSRTFSLSNLFANHPSLQLGPGPQQMTNGWHFFSAKQRVWYAYQNSQNIHDRGWWCFFMSAQRWGYISRQFWHRGGRWCPCCEKENLAGDSEWVCHKVDRDGKYTGPGAEGPPSEMLDPNQRPAT